MLAAPRSLWASLTLALAMLPLAPTAQAAPEAARARLNYLQHCSGCHLADGSGAPARGIPSMRGLLGQFLQVPGGRAFIVQVPGVMNSPLSDREIADVMNWLLPTVSAGTLPDPLPPYTAAEVAQLRQSRPTDVLGTRATLLRQMAAPATRNSGDAPAATQP